MRVLVTGGAGFIGSHIVDRLVKDHGSDVLVLDDFSFGRREFQERSANDCELVKGSICDVRTIEKLIKDVDIVIHAAAYADVGACVRNKLTDYKVNTQGTFNLLNAALEASVERFVFVSSASIYGNNVFSDDRPWFREDSAAAPLSTYAVSKLYGEQLAKVFYELYGLPTCSLRYFSIYGPRQIPKPMSHSWVVGIFVIRALRSQDLVVYGDGSQIRDFTYVDDVSEATVSAAMKRKASVRAG